LTLPFRVLCRGDVGPDELPHFFQALQADLLQFKVGFVGPGLRIHKGSLAIHGNFRKELTLSRHGRPNADHMSELFAHFI
jgi:hypothetical protein